MLLLLSGDVETNPGPIGRSRSREPKPDPKKIMEEKVDLTFQGAERAHGGIHFLVIIGGIARDQDRGAGGAGEGAGRPYREAGKGF